MRRKIFTIFLCIIMITLSLGAMGKNLVSKKIDNHIINDPET